MDTDTTTIFKNRCLAFWLIIIFMSLSVALLLLGQTMAIFNYEFAVSLGMQEDMKEISEFGVQINRAFGVSDTLIYIPFIALSIIGLILKKKWALITSAAVMGITLYWTTTAAFIFFFLEGVPGYSFVPGIEYWLFIILYIVLGLWGLGYLIASGDKLIN